MTTYAATRAPVAGRPRLRDDVLALRLQAVEDHPRDEPNKLVENVGAAARVPRRLGRGGDGRRGAGDVRRGPAGLTSRLCTRPSTAAVSRCSGWRSSCRVS